jgi:GNAT superfamily N-acetyltransferase
MPTDAPTFPFSERLLSQRLERAEAHSSACFVDARAKLSPAIGSCWIEVAGAYAMFDGPESPVTQTFGLGIFEAPTAGEMEAIEAFFTDRGAPVLHEVSPLADERLPPLLHARGYHPIEYTSILYRPIGAATAVANVPSARVTARLTRDGEQELWARTAADGWREFAGLGDFMRDMSRASAYRTDALLFLAEIDGVPIATGALSLCGGVAHLAGASTIPSARKQGAQLALLDARLRYAASRGCDLATMGALPGSGSQRNAERNGFRIAYTRTKWRLQV